MRRVAVGLGAVLLGIAGILVLLLVFSGRDKGGVDSGSGKGPGTSFRDEGSAHHAAPAGFRFSSSPPTSGPHRQVRVPGDGNRLTRDELLSALETGNVVILVPSDDDLSGAVAVRRQLQIGRTTPALLRSGQAVLLGTYPGTGKRTVAVAWGHLLRTAASNDSRLGDFANYWLGAGAPAAK